MPNSGEYYSLNSASECGEDTARHLALRVVHAGDFLLAVPNFSLGIHLNPWTIHIGVTFTLLPLSSLNTGVSVAVNQQTDSGIMVLFTVDLRGRLQGMKRLITSRGALQQPDA